MTLMEIIFKQIDDLAVELRERKVSYYESFEEYQADCNLIRAKIEVLNDVLEKFRGERYESPKANN